jgi:RNA polymerase sigma-70 factor, ECF subfamily
LSVERRDELYDQCAGEFGAALERLARGYEHDPAVRADLLQDIHLALWRSLAGFDGRCSLRTWVYRVAHNTATTFVVRQQRQRRLVLVGLEEIESMAAPPADGGLDILLGLIQKLKPLDRQVILSYLEGLDAASISDITGLSPSNIATKIHRIKNVLAMQFQKGVAHE